MSTSHTYNSSIKTYEEQNHKSIESNKKGVVYTDDKTASLIVKNLDPKLTETIWEPSVGGGIFIFALIEYILKTYNPTPQKLKEYIEKKVYFSDIDQHSLNFFVNNLSDFLAEYDVFDVTYNAKVMDGLKNEKHFDIIFGNPPYIRIKHLKKEYIAFLRDNFHSCKSGNIDIYYAFMEMSHKYSKRSSFIVPNSYLTNVSANNLRDLIAKDIVLINDYKEQKLFEASTYTSIYMTNKNGRKDFFNYGLYGKNHVQIYKKELYRQNKWDFSTFERLRRYENRTRSFLDIADIYAGVATNNDKCFVIENSTLKNGFFEKEYDGKTYFIEEDLCVEFKKLTKMNLNRSIIFPYKNINSIINEEELSVQFPFAYEYLLAIRDVLNKRDKGKVEGYDAWYAYGRRQGFNINFQDQTALLIPLVYKEDKFSFKLVKEEHRFIHSSGFVIVPKEGCYDQVIEVLNSNDFFEFLDIHGKKMPGETLFNSISAKILKTYLLPNKKINQQRNFVQLKIVA